MPCLWKTVARLGAWLILVGALVVASGCATYRFDDVAEHMAAKDIPGALKTLEKTKGADRDRVLYLLNRGVLLRMNGEYAASNDVFEEAKLLMEQLAAVSVSEQAGALSVNEGMRSYVGADYEKVLLHTYKVLNYLEMGSPAEARVEALQIDVLLQQMDANDPIGAEFARYLTGIVFEDLGEWDNAMIAYRKAYEAYLRQNKGKKGAALIPGFLKHDLLRLADFRGFTQEVDQFKKAFAIEQWQGLKVRQRQGEYVFLFLNNMAPIKREQAVQAQDPKSGHMLRISTPYMAPRPVVANHSTVRAGTQAVNSVILEDIDALAMQDLAHDMPKITARAIARAVIKYNASKKIQQQNGALGLMVNIAGVMTERADTRTWATLPQNIQLVRLPLEPGVYDIDVDIIGANGAVLETKRYSGIEIRAGEKVYRSYHWIAPFDRLYPANTMRTKH